MRQKVKVLKQDGRTGLRKPGTMYMEKGEKIEKLVEMELIEVVNGEAKTEHVEPKKDKVEAKPQGGKKSFFRLGKKKNRK